MIRAEAFTRVEFYDVDPMQVAWHGHYVRWMELGRRALLDRLDYGYEAMLRDGWSFPVVDLRLRYARPAVLGQELRILAELKEWENRVAIDYQISDARDGARLCRASSVQVAVRAGARELSFVCPPGWLERVARALAAGERP